MMKVKLLEGDYECVAEKTKDGLVTMRSGNIVIKHLVMRNFLPESQKDVMMVYIYFPALRLI